MKNALVALILLVMSGIVLADHRYVVVPTSTKPFTVNKTTLVRLAGSGIAGSTIKIDVTGPAKVEREAAIGHVNGRMIKVGGSEVEFELQPTGLGKVTATITVTFNHPKGNEPKKTTSEFEVK